MYKRILLTLDGSAMAEQAIPHAATLGELFQAELILLKVITPLQKKLGMYSEPIREVEEMTREWSRKYLECLAVNLRKSGIAVRTVIAEGHPHKEVVLFAEKDQVDLIVICTGRHFGLSRWLIGSVADRVPRGVNIPVLLVQARK